LGAHLAEVVKMVNQLQNEDLTVSKREADLKFKTLILQLENSFNNETAKKAGFI